MEAFVLDDIASTQQDTPVIFSILENDDNPSNAPLIIQEAANNGSMVVNDDGTITYMPDLGFVGRDYITYSLGDSEFATAVIDVVDVWEQHDGLSQTEVSQLYVSIFGRASEGAGNTFWQQMDNQADAATEMLATSAAKLYFGESMDSDFDFISHIYENTLGKNYAEDEAGINFWVKALDDGFSRGTVVSSLINAAVAPQYEGLAAQDQFMNKVAMSNYVANTIETVENATAEVLSSFQGYIDDITDELTTVVASQGIVDFDVSNFVMPDFGGILGDAYHEAFDTIREDVNSQSSLAQSRGQISSSISQMAQYSERLLTSNEEGDIDFGNDFSSDEAFISFMNGVAEDEAALYADQVSVNYEFNKYMDNVVSNPSNDIFSNNDSFFGHIGSISGGLSSLFSNQAEVNQGYEDLVSSVHSAVQQHRYLQDDSCDDADTLYATINSIVADLEGTLSREAAISSGFEGMAANASGDMDVLISELGVYSDMTFDFAA